MCYFKMVHFKILGSSHKVVHSNAVGEFIVVLIIYIKYLLNGKKITLENRLCLNPEVEIKTYNTSSCLVQLSNYILEIN